MNPDDQAGSSVEFILGRIEGKLDMSIAGQAEIKLRQDEQETRISSLEKGRAWLLGAGATVAAGISGVAALILR